MPKPQSTEMGRVENAYWSGTSRKSSSTSEERRKICSFRIHHAWTVKLRLRRIQRPATHVGVPMSEKVQGCAEVVRFTPHERVKERTAKHGVDVRVPSDFGRDRCGGEVPWRLRGCTVDIPMPMVQTASKTAVHLPSCRTSFVRIPNEIQEITCGKNELCDSGK